MPPSVLDDFFETYVSWREECYSLTDAYERWVNSGRDDRNLAVAAYRAALDREEQAAHTHRVCVDRVASSRRMAR